MLFGCLCLKSAKPTEVNIMTTSKSTDCHKRRGKPLQAERPALQRRVEVCGTNHLRADHEHPPAAVSPTLRVPLQRDQQGPRQGRRYPVLFVMGLWDENLPLMINGRLETSSESVTKWQVSKFILVCTCIFIRMRMVRAN